MDVVAFSGSACRPFGAVSRWDRDVVKKTYTPSTATEAVGRECFRRLSHPSDGTETFAESYSDGLEKPFSFPDQVAVGHKGLRLTYHLSDDTETIQFAEWYRDIIGEPSNVLDAVAGDRKN